MEKTFDVILRYSKDEYFAQEKEVAGLSPLISNPL